MNNKNVIIIGAGRVAHKHVKAIKTLRQFLTLSAIVDTNKENAQKLLNSSKLSYASNVKIYDNYEQAITDLSPDIVAITVPSGLHFKIATFALNNNCNLLLEKPMTMSSHESHELFNMSQDKNLKIAMGHIYRYFPLVSLIKEDIGNGVFGDITHGTITVRWGHGQDYYDLSAWRGTWQSDGGALMNQTIHAIDLLIWLMNSDAIEATALIAKRTRNIEADDLGMAILRLKSGALAQIEGTTATNPDNHEAKFNILGTKGSIELGLKKGKPFLNIRNDSGHKQNGKYIIRQLKTGGIKSFTYALNPHTAIYNDLYNSIINNTNPVADAKSGFTSVDNLMGIYKSALTRSVIALPLEENFESSDMNNYVW